MSFLYPSYLHDAVLGNINISTDTYKTMLLTDAYTPLKTHQRRSDVEANEISGSGYTSGGITRTLTTSFASGVMQINLAAVEFTGVTVTGVRYVVTYRDNGTTSADDELVAVNDLGTNQSDLSGSFKIGTSIYRNPA